MRPRRVAYVSHSSLLGGERVLLRLLCALDRARTEPLAVLPGPGPLGDALAREGVPVRETPLAWWIPATHWNEREFLAQLEGLPERAEALERLLRAEGVELVHSNVVVTLEGALAAARMGLPHVWHSRGLFDHRFPPPWSRDDDFLFGVLDRLSDAVVCVSEAVRRQTAPRVPHARVEVVYDGFDAEAFRRLPVTPDAEFRARHDIAPGARVAVSIGGIQRRKGLLDLVEAAALARRSDIVFLLAGAESEPEFAATLKERIGARRLADRFRFLGFQENVRDVLAHADVLVHPSLSEGFGFTVIEAMAAGRPVVATRCGGPEEIVREGVTGRLVAPGDPPALAAAIDRVLEDPGRAAAMGEAGRRDVERFTLEATARRTQDLDDAIAAGQEAPQTASRRAAAGPIADEVLRRGRAAARAGRSD